MTGKRITNHQIRLFMQSKQSGKSMEVAAAQAGFSERSAYNIAKIRNAIQKLKAWKTQTRSL